MAEQSITINFYSEVAEEDQRLVLDLDSDVNEEKTQFLYGEKCHFRVFKYPTDLVVTLHKSDGSISEEGSGVSEEEENITFVNTDSGSVSKPVRSVTSYEWLGASLGSVSAIGTAIKASQSGIAVLKLKYKSEFTRHAVSVSTKETETYPVVILAVGE